MVVGSFARWVWLQLPVGILTAACLSISKKGLNKEKIWLDVHVFNYIRVNVGVASSLTWFQVRVGAAVAVALIYGIGSIESFRQILLSD